MKYVRPDVYVERFAANDAVATGTCVWTKPDSGTITANCAIGGQTPIETSNSNIYFYYDEDKDGTNDYFFWYDTSTIQSAGTTPDKAVQEWMEGIIKDNATQHKNSGSGWHYAKIESWSKDGFWTGQSS